MNWWIIPMNIHIDWQGPLTVDQAMMLKSSGDKGLYQYYGDHPSYGANVLLYIGKTEEQTFGERLSQHDWLRAWIPNNAEIYVGRVCSETPIDNLTWKSNIDTAERILLFSHSPAMNTQNLNSTGLIGEDVHVLNWGKRKSLLPEVSVTRWEGGLTMGHDKPKSLNHCS